MDINVPFILDETEDYCIVFKPPRMHSSPLKKKEGNTIIEWYRMQSETVYDIIHRLDYETHGLVLIAKNKNSFDYFKKKQDNGNFIKEYTAVCANINQLPSADVSNTNSVLSLPVGFPPPPNSINFDAFIKFNFSPENPLVIESYFRSYGKGRKLVRPITEIKKYHEIAKDKGGFYRTEITGINKNVFTIRITRGFRHQIRCHLSWIGCPILNDRLYQWESASELTCQQEVTGMLALTANALFLNDNGVKKEWRIGDGE